MADAANAAEIMDAEHKRVMGQLLSALRLPREDATRKVDWLLAAQAFGIEADHSSSLQENDSWAQSVDRRLSELGDEPSTGYALESRQRGLEAELASADVDRTQIEERFDRRRETFAAMLQAVRDSRRVRLSEEILGKASELNADGYLAQSLGMDQTDFNAFYGNAAAREGVRRRAPGLEGAFPATGGIDFSKERVVPALDVEPARRPDRGSLAHVRATRLAREETPLDRETDTDWEPGL